MNREIKNLDLTKGCIELSDGTKLQDLQSIRQLSEQIGQKKLKDEERRDEVNKQLEETKLRIRELQDINDQIEVVSKTFLERKQKLESDLTESNVNLQRAADELVAIEKRRVVLENEMKIHRKTNETKKEDFEKNEREWVNHRVRKTERERELTQTRTKLSTLEEERKKMTQEPPAKLMVDVLQAFVKYMESTTPPTQRTVQQQSSSKRPREDVPPQ